MPTIHSHGATLYYEAHGNGFPILTFAPMGLQSTIDVWRHASAPVNPITEFAARYQVIAMDQRNAGGRSHAPITADDGWDTYTADHVAVLDHLGIERCHLFGQCIGGPFILNLIKHHPERVASAVIAQPIGRVAPELPTRTERFNLWASERSDHPEATEAVLDAFYRNLYAEGFAYAVDRDFVSRCQVPALVLAGNDAAHPYAIAEEIARLLPNAEFIAEWKDGAALEAARARMHGFLDAHTP
ncbi:MAG: alpha/beta fold hydrolase [Ectothiorhodospiraceae bacterium]|nr:alpha/beta fold hydrolase [Chromatiales bacterium]MCP5155660.1 alpha/beta fold hydrolase [Ectothiorhodospiraceae bacterium]